MATNKGRDHNYEKWLKETNKKDTKLNYGWYNCPEEKRSEYIKELKLPTPYDVLNIEKTIL